MKTVYITCEEKTRGTLSFFVTAAGEKYYLFSQDYCHTIWKKYNRGLLLNDSLDHAKCGGHEILEHMADKFPVYLKYIEDEYGIVLTRKGAKKASARNYKFKDKKKIRTAVSYRPDETDLTMISSIIY